MKFELKRTVRRIYEDTKKEDIEFKIIFVPENVEEALKLKEIEEVRRDNEIGRSYHDTWENNTFIISLS